MCHAKLVIVDYKPSLSSYEINIYTHTCGGSVDAKTTLVLNISVFQERHDRGHNIMFKNVQKSYKIRKGWKWYMPDKYNILKIPSLQHKPQNDRLIRRLENIYFMRISCPHKVDFEEIHIFEIITFTFLSPCEQSKFNLKKKSR